MTRMIKPAFAMWLLWSLLAAVDAVAQPASTRGEMLYATNCNACHTAQIHWRDKKIATNWNSLVAEVRRWQANAGLRWSDEEINDVARYLDSAYYGYPAGGEPDMDGKPR